MAVGQNEKSGPEFISILKQEAFAQSRNGSRISLLCSEMVYRLWKLFSCFMLDQWRHTHCNQQGISESSLLQREVLMRWKKHGIRRIRRHLQVFSVLLCANRCRNHVGSIGLCLVLFPRTCPELHGDVLQHTTAWKIQKHIFFLCVCGTESFLHRLTCHQQAIRRTSHTNCRYKAINIYKVLAEVRHVDEEKWWYKTDDYCFSACFAHNSCKALMRYQEPVCQETCIRLDALPPRLCFHGRNFPLTHQGGALTVGQWHLHSLLKPHRP